jgi:DNA mismatch repair protein MutL
LGRIRVLSDIVANKIAAGEVVERPASVVKELLENSLDAGATEIRLEVEAGGRRMIRIADNGCGMIRDDALLAFERHATSKLSDIKDLLAIATLGFRGEALPSIASVSRLTLQTRSDEESTGTRVEIAGGKIIKVDEVALPRGTSITVRDLFFNVPARKKFLRSEQTELAHIATLVTHYSLAHSDKTFLLRSSLNELLNVTPVAHVRERVFQVFGSQTLRDLVELPETIREIPVPEDDAPKRYKLNGFISGPQVQKANRNSIFLFVNGRLIRDRLLLHALTAAYANLIPPASYPFALLFLDCDPGEVDVNVHPSKTEVRFRSGSVVHDFVRDTVKDALMKLRPVTALPGAAASPVLGQSLYGQPAARLPFSEFTQAMEQGAPLEVPWSLTPDRTQPPPEVTLPAWQLRPPAGPAPRFDFGPTTLTPLPDPPPSAGVRLPVPDTHGPLPQGAFYEPESLEALRDLRPLGQLHDSFIIAAGRDGLWIIDQHVAHERILFEQVMGQSAAGQLPKQQLLMPMVLDLTPAQMVEYDRVAGEFHAFGFETESFGKRSIAVKTSPSDLSAGEVERVLLEILEIADRELRHATPDDLRRGMAASVACRAAIKINHPLDMTKMRWMLETLAQCEYPMSCPHGRPIALRYATREILKGFHRL